MMAISARHSNSFRLPQMTHSNTRSSVLRLNTRNYFFYHSALFWWISVSLICLISNLPLAFSTMGPSTSIHKPFNPQTTKCVKGESISRIKLINLLDTHSDVVLAIECLPYHLPQHITNRVMEMRWFALKTKGLRGKIHFGNLGTACPPEYLLTGIRGKYLNRQRLVRFVCTQTRGLVVNEEMQCILRQFTHKNDRVWEIEDNLPNSFNEGCPKYGLNGAQYGGNGSFLFKYCAYVPESESQKDLPEECLALSEDEVSVSKNYGMMSIIQTEPDPKSRAGFKVTNDDVLVIETDIYAKNQNGRRKKVLRSRKELAEMLTKFDRNKIAKGTNEYGFLNDYLLDEMLHDPTEVSGVPNENMYGAGMDTSQDPDPIIVNDPTLYGEYADQDVIILNNGDNKPKSSVADSGRPLAPSIPTVSSEEAATEEDILVEQDLSKLPKDQVESRIQHSSQPLHTDEEIELIERVRDAMEEFDIESDQQRISDKDACVCTCPKVCEKRKDSSERMTLDDILVHDPRFSINDLQHQMHTLRKSIIKRKRRNVVTQRRAAIAKRNAKLNQLRKEEGGKGDKEQNEQGHDTSESSNAPAEYVTKTMRIDGKLVQIIVSAAEKECQQCRCDLCFSC